jgi:hypothetical protein
MIYRAGCRQTDKWVSEFGRSLRLSDSGFNEVNTQSLIGYTKHRPALPRSQAD